MAFAGTMSCQFIHRNLQSESESERCEGGRGRPVLKVVSYFPKTMCNGALRKTEH